MGEFLSTPVKEKISNDGENSFVNNLFLKIYFFNYLVKIWFLLYARLEKKNGRFPHK